MNSLPSINKIFFMVMQHKCQFKNYISDESNILINAFDHHIPQGRGHENGCSFTSGNKKVCRHCGRNDHIVDTCYRKHDFPQHYGNYPVVANKSCIELNEEKEDVDDSKSC